MVREAHARIAGLSRRRFLIGITAGAAGLAASWHWLSATIPATHPAIPRTLALTSAQAYLVHRIAEAVLPAPGKDFPSIEQARVVERFDEESFFVSQDVRADILAALKVLDLLPLLYGHVTRFADLPLAERQKVLEKAFDSRFQVPRAASASLRLMVTLFYYGHPSSWKAIGYDGPYSHLPPKLSEQRQYYARRIGEHT